MTPAEFKSKLSAAQSIGALDLLMEHWSSVSGTLPEFDELRTFMLACYEAVACNGCEGSRDSRPALDETMEVAS